MALNISRNRVEIKSPVTQEVILDTDKTLPHLVKAFDLPNFITVSSKFVYILPELFLDAQTPVIWSIQGMDANEYIIDTDVYTDRLPLVWAKITNAAAGSAMATFPDGYIHIPGSLILECFQTNLDGRPFYGMTTLNILHRQNSLSLQVVRCVAGWKTAFYDISAFFGHDVPAITQSDSIAYVAPPESTVANKFYGREAYLSNTSFTISLKVNVMRSVT